MTTARIIWPPFPYRAGFAITDDCDATDLDNFRAVYAFLRSAGVVVTRTVWPFAPVEPSGIPSTPDSTLRGITLEDPGYLALCRELRHDGFEFCLHGASAGNNRRERTAAGLEIVRRELGECPVYVCHAKNAENIYWESRVAPTRSLRLALRLYSRHQCSGENPDSPYFWGDLCQEHIRYVRLFRTRNTNTLAANPSMPYHESGKPWVRGWFSATKRSFRDCASPPALTKLRQENGLTILYQYLHRYADPATSRPRPDFQEAVLRLASDPAIWKATVTQALDRLSRIQEVFAFYRDSRCWLVNTGSGPIPGLQVALSDALQCDDLNHGITRHGRLLRVRELPVGTTGFRFDRPVRFVGPRTAPVPPDGRASCSFGHGRLLANLGDEPWPQGDDSVLVPGSFSVRFRPGLERLRPMSCPGRRELHRLFYGQFDIIRSEVMGKGRSLKTDRFLSTDRIRLEDHDEW